MSECVQVRREHLLDDTVMCLRSINPAMFKKPLKVRTPFLAAHALPLVPPPTVERVRRLCLRARRPLTLGA